MIDRIGPLIQRVRKSERKKRFVSWSKGIFSEVSKENLPINYLVEGGPVRRGKVAVVILCVTVPASWFAAETFTHNHSQRINLFSSLTNLLLTLGLIWVYLSIAESERTQAEFVEEQTKLQDEIQSLQETQVNVMAAEFEPVIEILEYGKSATRPQDPSVSFEQGYPHGGDPFEVKLSNLSGAIATNLRLRFILDYLGRRSYATGADIPLSRIDNSQSLTSKPGGVLQGHETEIRYHCVAGLHLPILEQEEPLPISLCLSNLFENDTSHIRLGLVLVFEDRKGSEHEIEIEGLDLTSSDIASATPSLARIRNEGDEIPIELVKEKLLNEGIPDIPPRYWQ